MADNVFSILNKAIYNTMCSDKLILFSSNIYRKKYHQNKKNQPYLECLHCWKYVDNLITLVHF